MSFTVEDGTGIAGATSYIALVDARAYALDRDLTLPSDDTECQQSLVRGFDYVESFRGQYKGSRTTATQAGQFPRTGIYIDGQLLAAGDIPDELKFAQVEAAVADTAGVTLLPTTTKPLVKRKKTGPLETEYETSGGRGSASPRMTAIEALLRPLLKSGGAVRTVRA